MKLHSANHVHTVVPNWNDNRKLPLDERIEFDLKGVSQRDIDSLAAELEERIVEEKKAMATAIETELTLDQTRKHFIAVRNLVVDDKPVIDFDDFYNRAPRELVSWVVKAIRNTFVLLEAEAKNFEPGSGSDSGSEKIPAT